MKISNCAAAAAKAAALLALCACSSDGTSPTPIIRDTDAAAPQSLATLPAEQTAEVRACPAAQSAPAAQPQPSKKNAAAQ